MQPNRYSTGKRKGKPKTEFVEGKLRDGVQEKFTQSSTRLQRRDQCAKLDTIRHRERC